MIFVNGMMMSQIMIRVDICQRRKLEKESKLLIDDGPIERREAHEVDP